MSTISRSNRTKTGLTTILLVFSIAFTGKAYAQIPITVTGTVMPGVEASCWILLDDYGNTYEIFGGDENLYIEGITVMVEGLLHLDWASYCMQGIILEVQLYQHIIIDYWCIQGDANGGGEVNVSDIMRVLRIPLGLEPVPASYSEWYRTEHRM